MKKLIYLVALSILSFGADAQQRYNTFPTGLTPFLQNLPYSTNLTDTLHSKIFFNDGYGNSAQFVLWQNLRDTLSHYQLFGNYLLKQDSGNVANNYVTYGKYAYGATTQYNKTFVAPILGVARATSLNITGTGGNGYINLGGQVFASIPTPTGSMNIYSAGLTFGMKANNGFNGRFSLGSLTADRSFTLPDANGTLALTTDITGITGPVTISAGVSALGKNIALSGGTANSWSTDFNSLDINSTKGSSISSDNLTGYVILSRNTFINTSGIKKAVFNGNADVLGLGNGFNYNFLPWKGAGVTQTVTVPFQVDTLGNGQFLGTLNSGVHSITNSPFTGFGLFINGLAYGGSNWALSDGAYTANGKFEIDDFTNSKAMISITKNTGAVQFNQYGAGAATFDASGNITSVSDRRLKDSIGVYRAGLSKILKLKPVIFKYNKLSGLETEHEYAGFFAQNVKANLPLSTGQNAAGFLSLQDRAIMAALVNSVKELQAEIVQLKKQIKKKH